MLWSWWLFLGVFLNYQHTAPIALYICMLILIQYSIIIHILYVIYTALIFYIYFVDSLIYNDIYHTIIQLYYIVCIYCIRHMVPLFCQALPVSGAASQPSALSSSSLTSLCPPPPKEIAGWSYNFLPVVLGKPRLAPLSRPLLVHNALHLFSSLLSLFLQILPMTW